MLSFILLITEDVFMALVLMFGGILHATHFCRQLLMSLYLSHYIYEGKSHVFHTSDYTVCKHHLTHEVTSGSDIMPCIKIDTYSVALRNDIHSKIVYIMTKS